MIYWQTPEIAQSQIQCNNTILTFCANETTHGSEDETDKKTTTASTTATTNCYRLLLHSKMSLAGIELNLKVHICFRYCERCAALGLATCERIQFRIREREREVKS